MAASLLGQRRTVFIDEKREGIDIKEEWVYDFYVTWQSDKKK
jgi:hypothetical protein